MTEETTTEQLAEIEGQAMEYTPPEGWRVVRFGELLLPGDEWVNWEGTVSRPDILHGDGTTASGGRYIRRIKQEPQAEPQPEPESDAELRVRLLKQANDSQAETIGRLLTEARDLNMEIGGLERRLSERDARIRDLEIMHAAATQAVVDAGKVNDKLRAQAEELRSEVSYVQNLLGTERRRVAELEELVTSLRTINDAQEKAFTAANNANTDLQHRLNVVAAEWAEQAETSRRLQIELDAAQQVPAGSADRFEEGWNQGTAHAVETIAEWLEPFEGCNSASLALLLLESLPNIMRHLAGLGTVEED